MATDGAPAPAREVERIPFMQRLLDNPFLFFSSSPSPRALHAVGLDGSGLGPARKMTFE